MWFCTIDQWSPSPAGVPSVDDVLALHGQGRSYSCTSIKDFDENALIVTVFEVDIWRKQRVLFRFPKSPFLEYI